MSSVKPTSKSVKSFNSLREVSQAMAYVFHDAQFSLSGHRKLVIVMKSISQRATELGLQDSFFLKFTKLINKILPLKKGEVEADRIAKFCSNFISSLYADEANRKDQSSDDREVEDEPAFIVKFVDFIVRHLLRGIQAKDKNVRYRVVQLIAYIVNYIGEMDEELFRALHWSLNKRLFDKEANVRIQAVVALSSFQYFDLESDINGDNKSSNSATLSLLHTLQHDESAEVRRAALLNLIQNTETLPYLLERGRDLNSINRRLVYTRILKEVGDFRLLSFKQREDLLKWGFNDRGESVLSSVIKLFCYNWLDTVDGSIIKLVDSLSVVESGVAQTAMQFLFKNRQDIVLSLKFDEKIWKELSVEKAFLVRTFYEYCNNFNLYELIENNYPESVELAKFLSQYMGLRKKIIEENSQTMDDYNTYKSELEAYDKELSAMKSEEQKLLSDIEESSSSSESSIHQIQQLRSQFEETLEKRKDKIIANKELSQSYLDLHEQLCDLEFIIHQLLLVSKDYDFSDEIGRREMLQIMRSSLSNDKLPDKLIETSLKVLSKISISERDFIAMCTEIVTDIRDSYIDEADEESFHSAISGFQNSDSEEEFVPMNESSSGNMHKSKRSYENSDLALDDEETLSPHKRRKKEPKQPPDDIIIRCLSITQHLLELTSEPLANNYSLGSLIESLVRPAVLRNEKPFIRHLGMKCLGLFCLIDKNLAIENLFFFGIAAAKADESLRTTCIKVIFDILSTYGISVLDIQGGVDSLSLARLFYKILRTYEMPKLQCVVAEGLCKLFLADVLTNFGKSDNKENNLESDISSSDLDKNGEDQEKQLLETLLLTYFHPLNSENHELRQILAFCIPVYAFSHPKHQEKIASLSGDCFFRMYSENGEASKFENFSSSGSVIQQLIYWCDPNNLVNVDEDEKKRSPSHFWQVMTFLQAIEQDTPKSVKRTIINNLNKIYITQELGSKLLHGLLGAIQDTKNVIDANSQDPDFQLDASASKNLAKFLEHISNLVEKAESMEKEEYKSEDDISTASTSSNYRKAADSSPASHKDSNTEIERLKFTPEEHEDEQNKQDQEVSP